MRDQALIDFVDLAVAYLDGRATESQVTDLCAALEADPAKRDLFVDLSMTPELIRESHQTAAAKPDDVKKATGDRAQETTPLSAAGVPMYRKGYEPQPFKLRTHHYAVLAATLLVACGLAVYLLTASVDPKPDPVDPNQPPAPVATLIQNTGNLRTPHGYPAEGDDYGRGEYTLSSGTAEFMLTNAVNVKLRGDTRMVMRNNMNVALTRGSAEFVVPHDAKGFTVHLPDGSKVVDLGTRFTVHTDDDGRSVVWVRKGSVSLESRHGPPRILGVGDAVRFDADTDGSMRFESDALLYRFTFNAAPDEHTGVSHGVAIVGGSPTIVRSEDDQPFARFDGGDRPDADRIDLDLTSEELVLGDFSIAMRIRESDLTQINFDDWLGFEDAEGQWFHLERRGRSGTLSFYFDGDGEATGAIAATTSINDGRWHDIELIGRTSGDDAVLTLHIDGEPQGQSLTLTESAATELGHLRIAGRVGADNRYIKGDIDEVRIGFAPQPPAQPDTESEKPFPHSEHEPQGDPR